MKELTSSPIDELREPKVKKKRKGLGDEVEGFIKAALPKLASKYKDCKGCKNRKEFLNNNFNAFFG